MIKPVLGIDKITCYISTKTYINIMMSHEKMKTYIYSENTFDYNKHGIVFFSRKKMVNIIFADKTGTSLFQSIKMRKKNRSHLSLTN